MKNKTEKVESRKAIAAVDEAYQLGYMDGFKSAKQQAMMEQIAQFEEEKMMAGQPGAEGGAEGGGQGPESLPRPIPSNETSQVSEDSASPGAPQGVPPQVAEEQASQAGGELMNATDNLINMMSKVEIPAGQKILKKNHETMIVAAKKLKEIGFKSLQKSVKSLPLSKRKIVHQQDATVTKILDQWEAESKAALKKIISIADKHKKPEEK